MGSERSYSRLIFVWEAWETPVACDGVPNFVDLRLFSMALEWVHCTLYWTACAAITLCSFRIWRIWLYYDVQFGLDFYGDTLYAEKAKFVKQRLLKVSEQDPRRERPAVQCFSWQQRLLPSWCWVQLASKVFIQPCHSERQYGLLQVGGTDFAFRNLENDVGCKTFARNFTANSMSKRLLTNYRKKWSVTGPFLITVYIPVISTVIYRIYLCHQITVNNRWNIKQERVHMTDTVDWTSP